MRYQSGPQQVRECSLGGVKPRDPVKESLPEPHEALRKLRNDGGGIQWEQHRVFASLSPRRREKESLLQSLPRAVAVEEGLPREPWLHSHCGAERGARPGSQRPAIALLPPTLTWALPTAEPSWKQRAWGPGGQSLGLLGLRRWRRDTEGQTRGSQQGGPGG